MKHDCDPSGRLKSSWAKWNRLNTKKRQKRVRGEERERVSWRERERIQQDRKTEGLDYNRRQGLRIPFSSLHRSCIRNLTSWDHRLCNVESFDEILRLRRQEVAKMNVSRDQSAHWTKFFETYLPSLHFELYNELDRSESTLQIFFGWLVDGHCKGERK